MTDWVEHPDLPDLYYRRDGRTVHMAGRDVVYPPKRNSPDGYTAALSAASGGGEGTPRGGPPLRGFRAHRPAVLSGVLQRVR